MMKRLKGVLSRGVRFVAREIQHELASRTRAPMRKRAPLLPVRDRAVRVVFVVEFAESWVGFESVWQAFCGDPLCETTVVAVTESPYFKRVKTMPRQFLADSGIPFVASDFYDIAHSRPDVIFFHNPYEGMRPGSLRLHHVQQHVARTVYIPYGFEIGGGGQRVNTQFNNPLQREAWRVFVRSDRFKALYRRKCAAGDAHVVVSGHPMVDAVLARARSDADPMLREFVGDRRSILWNPHYGEYKDQRDFSTFLRWKDLLLSLFAGRRDRVLILRPHPMLFNHLLAEELMTQREIEAFRMRFQGAANMIIDERADFTHAMAVSDALMSDASSFLTLYGVTGKPILYLPNPSGPGLNEEGEIVHLYYSGETEDAIRSFVQMVGNGEDAMRTRRVVGIEKFVSMPKEGAGMFIKNHIMDALQWGGG